MASYLSFRLSDTFLAPYKEIQPPFGFKDPAGNSLGEGAFIRSYSRRKDDGSKERWWEVCRRVIEGTFSVQKDHCKFNHLPWQDKKAQRSAQEAYDMLFNLKWSPPGRGLWMMGTEFVNSKKDGTPLQNCMFLSTKDINTEFSYPFRILQEASMLGVGVGFDTKGADHRIQIKHADETDEVFVIADTREGWIESTGMIIDAFMQGTSYPIFDYCQIRPEGAPIKTFGGVAAGPGPLIKLHERLVALFTENVGQEFDSRLITDVANLIGVCTVSGNVRRSALIAVGAADDDTFLNLKNYEEFPYRTDWGWMSNNSILGKPGMDYEPYVQRIIDNGEPGVIWLDNVHNYGRMNGVKDVSDSRVLGFNPCAEMPLESYECCTLSEVYPSNCKGQNEFRKAMKYSYLYGKTVTLLATRWERTNAIMQRNRRVGTSISGLAELVDREGYGQVREWMQFGYNEIQRLDNVYSEWLTVRPSIRTTTVKPSGTVSLLAGVTPGVHWPVATTYIRRMRLSNTDPLLAEYKRCGYRTEPAFGTEETTTCVEIPIRPNTPELRNQDQVSIYEKTYLAALAQRHWSDNGVSVTVTFDRETEGGDIARVLSMYDDALKAVSFLPIDNTAYPQMPYETLTPVEMDHYMEELDLKPLDLSVLYDNGAEAIGESGCVNDVCELKTAVAEVKGA